MKGPLEDQPEGRPSWVVGGQLQVGVQGVSGRLGGELLLTMPGQRVQDQVMMEPIQVKTVLPPLSPISAWEWK